MAVTPEILKEHFEEMQKSLEEMLTGSFADAYTKSQIGAIIMAKKIVRGMSELEKRIEKLEASK